MAPKGLMVVPSKAYVLIVCPGRNPRVLATTREKLLLGVSTGGPFVVVVEDPRINVPEGIVKGPAVGLVNVTRRAVVVVPLVVVTVP